MISSKNSFISRKESACEKARSTTGTGSLSSPLNEVEIETHDVFARVTADGISTTGDCVRNKDSQIYKIADQTEGDFITLATKKNDDDSQNLPFSRFSELAFTTSLRRTCGNLKTAHGKHHKTRC